MLDDISFFSIGENILALVDTPGVGCRGIPSASSKNGFVERGRSGRLIDEMDPGERARFRKGLLEPKLAAVGESWYSVGRRDVLNQSQV